MSYLIDHFKAHDQNRADLAAILTSPVWLRAVHAILEDEKTTNIVLPDNDAIVSARVLAYLTGLEDMPRRLLGLTISDRPSVQQPDETWGAEEAARKLQEEQSKSIQP